MTRLLPPLLLHLILLIALILGVPVSSRPAVTIATATGWRIGPAKPQIIRWASRPPQAHDLSAIAWLGGDRYALVSDKGGHLLWGEIKVDAHSGAVVSAKVLSAVVRLAGCWDVEGCAVSPDGQNLVVSDEQDAGLTRFPLAFGASGALRPLAKKTAIVKGFRNNLSLESLAACVDGSGYWTMNEDALAGDGSCASLKAGAWLRLQEVGLDLQPVRQWFYFGDPIPGGLQIPGAVNGVSDVLALPDGRLLVMERGFGTAGFAALGFVTRLYLVNPAADLPDVTATAHLDQPLHTTPLAKELLFEWTGQLNFEGITLGPTLADGARVLLLVADDGDPLSSAGLLALKLEWVESR